MQKKNIFKVGVALLSTSFGAYYNKEIVDGSVGAIRFAKTARTVSNLCSFSALKVSQSWISLFFLKVGEILVDYKRTIYSKTIDISSKQYPQMRSDVCIKNSLIFRQYLTTDKLILSLFPFPRFIWGQHNDCLNCVSNKEEHSSK